MYATLLNTLCKYDRFVVLQVGQKRINLLRNGNLNLQVCMNEESVIMQQIWLKCNLFIQHSICILKKLLLAIFTTTLFFSCGKPCFETRGIEGAGLTITFFHIANNEYFYPRNTNLSIFKIDSLQVKDSRGNQLRTPYSLALDSIDPLRQFYRVSIYPIFIPQDDQAAFDSEQTKFIYIKYNYNTFDTLKLVYKAKKEKCANKYEYLKAYYKNALISESYNSYSQGLLFKLNH